MKKIKDFDTFSFRADSRKQIDSARDETDLPIQIKTAPINWRDMTYRYETKSKIGVEGALKDNSSPQFESYYVNEKISKIDEQLTQNIRRRIELEKKLYLEKQENREKQNELFFQQNNVQSDAKCAQIYTDFESKSNQITRLIARQPSSPKNNYFSQVQANNSSKNRFLASKQSPKKPIVPDQYRLQKLVKLASFPQIPKCNIEKLEKQCSEIMINSQHSDAVYVMMVASFHLQKYHNVRKYFREIQMYKVFEPTAYWIACETEYELNSYQICLKLCAVCMKQISDVHLPRFVYLQAKCYDKIANYINSVVCYNQLIKMKPKMADFYLERGIIYDKIGYPKEAREDYLQFGALEPLARNLLRDKIIGESDEMKRKLMIKALAKIQ